MDSDLAAARLRTIGLAAAWVVLAILAASMAYAAIIAVVNWGPIGV